MKKKWNYGMAAGAVAATVACVAGAGVLLDPQSAARGGAKRPTFIGPVPCQKAPADIVTLTTLEKLGKNILYDCTLSNPEGYACATCHMPQTGFTSPLTNGSTINLLLGCPPGNIVGRFDNRRAMSYGYAAFSPEGPYYDAQFAQAYVGGCFWDGRVVDTTQQATEPFLNPDEMNNTPTNGVYPPPVGGYSALVVQKVIAKYGNLFKEAYGSNILDTTTVDQQYLLVCAAEAAFEGSSEVCQFSSKYDASKYGVPPQTKYTLSASEERGRQLYFGAALCSTCHSSATFPPVLAQTNGKDTFSMYCFANVGVPRNYQNPFYQMTDCKSNPHGCNSLGGKWVDYGLGANPNPGLDGTKFYNSTPGDIPQYRGLFQSTTTRNVDLRPTPDFVKAYMHNGVFKSLKEVVHFYNKRNIAVNAQRQEVAFDWTTGPPAGYTPLFAPPEVLDNVQNVQGALGNLGNLGLTDQQENDIVAFLKILSDGYTAPNPVGASPSAKSASKNAKDVLNKSKAASQKSTQPAPEPAARSKRTPKPAPK